MPGVRVSVVTPQSLGIRSDGRPVEMVLGGPDYEQLREWRDVMLAVMNDMPQLIDTDSNYQERKPQMRVSVDRNRGKVGTMSFDPSYRPRGMAVLGCTFCLLLLFSSAPGAAPGQTRASSDRPYVLVLGVAQDGGVPQAGSKEHSGWDDPTHRRLAACLAVVDPASSERWLLDATPDFREQLHRLDVAAPVPGKPGLAGIFLTHAHMGHYTGLMHLGHEAMGADAVPVYAMPRMGTFLRDNGPWSQLVNYRNIEIRVMDDGSTIKMNQRLELTAFLVPHRQEYSEVAGFIVRGPERAVLFVPDIDSWEEWDKLGTSIESVIAEVDVAYLDGTFFDDGEIPGRDMSGFPHPKIARSMERFSSLPDSERSKIRFIHLNHTNPALKADGEARREIVEKGFLVATEGEIEKL